MKEYTFLGTKSFRSAHIKAATIREAWRIAKAWYIALPKNRRESFGDLTSTFQTAGKNDMCMSGWKSWSPQSLKRETIKGERIA